MTATAPEPTEQPAGSDDGNRTLYWIIGIVVIAPCTTRMLTATSLEFCCWKNGGR